MENVSSNIVFCGHLATGLVSSHVTAGLCKIAGFECLSHSSSLLSILSILKNGASPQKALANAQKQSEAKFFLFKDSETRLFEKIISSRYYAFDPGFFLGRNFAGCLTKNEKIKLYAANLFAFFHLLFPPTVYFTYTKEEIKQGDLFQDDQIAELRKKVYGVLTEKERQYWENMGKKALETTKSLPNHRIGLVGVIAHMSIKNVVNSACKDPLRVIQGVAQVAIGCYLTILGVGLIT